MKPIKQMTKISYSVFTDVYNNFTAYSMLKYHI